MTQTSTLKFSNQYFVISNSQHTPIESWYLDNMTSSLLKDVHVYLYEFEKTKNSTNLTLNIKYTR